MMCEVGIVCENKEENREWEFTLGEDETVYVELAEGRRCAFTYAAFM